MNYLIDLTKEEIKYICTVIPYQETVSYFRRYPKEFTKLRPGFRVKTLNEDMITRILYEFRTRNFIASYLIKHIDRWMKEIDEEMRKAKELGLDMEASYINVLSRSFFADNIALFFKIKGEERSKDYLKVLDSAVVYEADNRKKEKEELETIRKKMIVLVENRAELEQQIVDGQKRVENLKMCQKEMNEKLRESSQALNEEQERCRKIVEKTEKLEIALEKAQEDEVWKSSEMQQKIDALSLRLEEQVEQANSYKVNTSELESKLSSVKDDLQTWKNQVRIREKQIFTYKAEKATLLTEKDADKKQIKELKEALEQALSVEREYKEQLVLLRSETGFHTGGNNIKSTFEEQKIIETSIEVASRKYMNSEYNMLMCPEDMEDFFEYFIYNLENIGFDRSEDGALDFLDYIKKILFHGIPLLIKRGPGINLADSLANTLYGVPIAARMSYVEDANIEKVEEFLTDTPDRVVCIDGFIGNCNVMELIPVLEQHRNKIVILTYMFDKTLTFIPNEILSYVYFISADVFSTLLRIRDITEDPSEIKEKPYANKRFVRADTRLQKIFRDIACECGIETSAALAMSDIIEDENQLNEMLMFTLLPYVSKVLGKSPYNCSKRLQHYAGEKGRSLKKDIIMRWFG